MRRPIVTAVAAILAVAGCWFAWPATLGGQTTYVTTSGRSMEPRFHSGDLAVVRAAGSYRVGDVVAYHSDLLHTVVMHRIVAVEDGRHTFKGDNNSWLDPERPTLDRLIGKLALRVPQGGVWFDRLASPPVLGFLALLLLTTGGAAAQTKRQRRRRAMSRQTTSSAHRSPAGRVLSPRMEIAAAVIATVAVLGAGLGVLGWGAPLESVRMVERHVDQSVTFSYSTAVPKSAAYDGTLVTSPDPVFRKLANGVDVHYSYRGQPGNVAVAAKLSTASGWHSTMPLAGPTAFGTDSYEGTVRLDLKAISARAQAAAGASGVPATDVSIAVVPAVTTPGTSGFTPALRLTLSPLQLTLVGDAAALTVKNASTVQQSTRAPKSLGLLGRHLRVSTARGIATGLLLAAALAGVWLLLLGRRSRPASEAAGIHRRYAPLLVAVEPLPAPPGRPIVDVTEFATLAKLAERYGLLILHWSRSEVETFVLQDEGMTYRYRSGAAAEPVPAAAEPMPPSR